MVAVKLENCDIKSARTETERGSNWLTPLPMNASARWPTAISILCTVYFCSQETFSSLLLEICFHLPDLCNASFSSLSHGFFPLVMM